MKKIELNLVEVDTIKVEKAAQTRRVKAYADKLQEYKNKEK